MLDPMTLALLAQAGFGVYQGIKGNQLAKDAIRPEYQIPEEISQSLSDAEIAALEGLPQAQKDAFLQNVQRSTATSLNALGDRQAGLAGISSVQQNEQDAMTKLLSMDAQARQSNMNNLYDQRNTMAGYKDKAFQINEMQPFEAQAQAAEAMKGAGIQNVAGGLTGAANSYNQYTAFQDFMKGLENKKALDNQTTGNTQGMQQKPADQTLQSGGSFTAPNSAGSFQMNGFINNNQQNPTKLGILQAGSNGLVNNTQQNPKLGILQALANLLNGI